MTPEFRISGKALEDLENIWLYSYRKWSIEQADKYHRLIIDEIEFIVSHYELSRNADYIRDGYKVAKVKSHLIYFKKSNDDIIEIIRILHQKMDIENRINER